MHYIVHCLDHTGAVDLRLAHYDAHKAYLASKPINILVSGPLLADDNETMIGSLFLVEADCRADVQRFSDADPFRAADLWAKIDIHPILKRVDNR